MLKRIIPVDEECLPEILDILDKDIRDFTGVELVLMLHIKKQDRLISYLGDEIQKVWADNDIITKPQVPRCVFK